MRTKFLLILFSVLSLQGVAQDPSDNLISRKYESALPNEYPNGVYLMDSEADPNWSWPEDAGVVLGLKAATSNSRHAQMLFDRYANKIFVRGKNWGNNAWKPWNRLLVEVNGQVGIGTTSPTSMLDIDGGTLKVRNPGTARSLRLYSSANEHAPNWTGILSFNIDETGDLDFDNVRGSRLIFGGSGTLTFQTSTIGSGTQTLNTALDISSSGKVGIGGITNASEELEVAGTILAEEVRVEATGGPDYVFEEDYDLIALSEVRAFIKQNKRLPEVPSAAEMEKEGLNVGEMNLLLLKKLEELTLYLLEKDEEIKDLQQEVRSLKDL